MIIIAPQNDSHLFKRRHVLLMSGREINVPGLNWPRQNISNPIPLAHLQLSVLFEALRGALFLTTGD